MVPSFTVNVSNYNDFYQNLEEGYLNAKVARCRIYITKLTDEIIVQPNVSTRGLNVIRFLLTSLESNKKDKAKKCVREIASENNIRVVECDSLDSDRTERILSPAF